MSRSKAHVIACILAWAGNQQTSFPLELASESRADRQSAQHLKLSHAGEVAEGDPDGVVIAEQLEDLLDVLTRILLAHLAGHHPSRLTWTNMFSV